MSDGPEEIETAEGGAASPDAIVAELEQKLRDTEARLRAVSKAYADQRAEMTAFRERVEAQDRVRMERKEFEVVSLFLDPVEDLQRSLEAGGGDADALLAGVRMVHQRFVDALTRLGLRPVPGVGAAFDPSVHDAIGTVPVGSADEEGRVLVVAQEGYVHGSKVLRAARVLVGRHEAEAAEA